MRERRMRALKEVSMDWMERADSLIGSSAMTGLFMKTF